MKILLVNKFLFPHGGSETYIFDLGRQFTSMGHEVQYFGMDAENNIVGNHAESYTSCMDFHASGIKRFFYPFKIIYSVEARKKIRKVLDDFEPDVIHLNNINFQLTPSIIYEIRKWEKNCTHKVKIVYTAHDAQWVCPNHLLMIPSTNKACMQCRGGKYYNCVKNRCIHGSRIKSLLGAIEAQLYRCLNTYKKIDVIICPSNFMKEVLSSNLSIAERLIVLHNYCPINAQTKYEKKNYVLYFGRYSEEKGIATLIKACRNLPQVSFVFAGDGPYKKEIEMLPNVRNLGFLRDEQLQKAIGEARFAVVPSVWYENCPFTVIEAQRLGTPVLGANIGGIPELIDVGVTGEVFEPGNARELENLILHLWNDMERCEAYSENCYMKPFTMLREYCRQMVSYYEMVP